MKGMPYNAPIDGLRAIAVLAVVAYHIGLPVPAGFVGVDIFFVISGYLITRLLHDELQRTGRIDLVEFYARRARRILPAITVVMITTVLASILLLPRADVAATGKAAAAAFLFAANIFFANAPAGYFDTAQDNPLLHLWSLGVEEQFYLLWPLALLLARKKPVAILAMIALASFLLCEWMLSSGHDQHAFYQTPARAWELATGGLIAFSRFRPPRWIAWIGLSVIAVALILPYGRFPGSGALPAVIGASMLIASFHGGQSWSILETRPMLWVGVRSYSLYLWHWPVVVLGRDMSWYLQLTLALVLAALSFRCVETPFRRRWVLPPRPSLSVAMLLVALGAAGAYSVHPLQFGAAPFPPANVPSPYRMQCDDWHRSAEVKPCRFGPDDAPRKAVIIGDSVTMQWFPAAYEVFDGSDWQLVVLTKAACPMVDASYFYERIGRIYTECDEWRRRSLAWVADFKPDVLIMGSANNYRFSPDEWREGTRRTIATLANHTRDIRLLRSTPLLVPGGSESFEDVATWEREAVAGLANVQIVDMNGVVCPRGCARSSAAGRLFRDDRHIDWDYAATLADEFREKLRIPGLQ